MSDAVIVALVSLLGVIFTAVWQNKRLSADFEKQSELADARLEQAQAVTNEKIDELARRVEKHNQVVERVFRLEQDSAVQAEQIKVANHRIGDLEKGGAA